MSSIFNHVRRFFGSPAGYKVRWPRPRTVGPGRGRSRRRRLWGTFACVRAYGRYTKGMAMLPSLFLRGVPPRAPRLKAPSTRTRAKSCAIIAALGEICLAPFPPRSANARAPGRRPRVVHARRPCGRSARVHQPQPAPLSALACRVEEHHPVHAVRLGHHIVHRRQKAADRTCSTPSMSRPARPGDRPPGSA